METTCIKKLPRSVATVMREYPLPGGPDTGGGVGVVMGVLIGVGLGFGVGEGVSVGVDVGVGDSVGEGVGVKVGSGIDGCAISTALIRSATRTTIPMGAKPWFL